MQEDAAGAFTLQFIFMLLIFFLLGFFIFGIQNIQTIDFNNYVNAQLESHGGLTHEALSNIQEYSYTHYQGRYEVSSLSGNSKLPYGETIDYEIRGNIKIYFMELPNEMVLKRGSTISLVR